MARTRLWLANEVAEYCRLSLPRVYELTRSGVIPSIRVGERQLRYDPKAINAWLAASGRPSAKYSAEPPTVTELAAR
jgi:excisionase family DNA binding protein